MDIVPLLFLLGIVLVSGIIALVADNLGRKLGKKRLWLKLPFLHLRPKHTAQGGVFLSGVIVSFLTIFVVAVLSKDVKVWILQGRQALRELQVVQGDLKNLRQEGDQLSRTNDSLEQKVSLGERKVSEQEKTLNNQRQLIKAGEAKIKGLEAKLKDGSAKIKDLDRKLIAKDTEYKAAKSNLTAAKSALVQGKIALGKVRADLTLVKTNRKLAIDEYNEILERNTKIENDNRVLENSVQKLTADTERLKGDLQSLNSEREKVALELSEKIETLQDLQAKLNETEDRFRELRSQYVVESQLFSQIGDTFIKSRKERITYQLGEEVARTVVPANASPEEAKKALDELIRSSRSVAMDRGAKKVGDYDAADIVAHYDAQLNRSITPEDIRQSLVRQLAGKSEPQVIVGSSSLNAFAGEPVSLEVSIFPNPLVYRQGQVVAEAKVDGKKELDDIFRQVQGQLADRLNERVRKDQMIPKAGLGSGYGTLEPEEIFDIVNRVRKADRKVTLRAIAEVDTRAGDPLRLRFGIR
ncbi:DUF3084 domain-containing protein [bacterium]|nr:MAG: DUF3084 domain-containing protein [bacterium]